jgi:hypothetical protein
LKACGGRQVLAGNGGQAVRSPKQSPVRLQGNLLLLPNSFGARYGNWPYEQKPVQFSKNGGRYGPTLDDTVPAALPAL